MSAWNKEWHLSWSSTYFVQSVNRLACEAVLAGMCVRMWCSSRADFRAVALLHCHFSLLTHSQQWSGIPALLVLALLPSGGRSCSFSVCKFPGKNLAAIRRLYQHKCCLLLQVLALFSCGFWQSGLYFSSCVCSQIVVAVAKNLKPRRGFSLSIYINNAKWFYALTFLRDPSAGLVFFSTRGWGTQLKARVWLMKQATQTCLNQADH